MKKLFYFFIDGLGIGNNGNNNPLADLFNSSLGGKSLTGISSPFHFVNGVIVPLDASQGVPGLPQSATGQTSLYTGLNAQKLVGHHITAFPSPRLMRLIRERSILKKLTESGISTTSANLYSEEFFINRSGKRKNMLPVSTLSIKAAGLPFRMKDEYLKGKALSADITNLFLRERGVDFDLITPEEGARRISSILAENQAVFFEYFMTDVFGHKRDPARFKTVKNDLDRFLSEVLRITQEDSDTAVLIVSDHGNAEDISTGDHTLNLVPLILFSKNREAVNRASSCRRLTDAYYLVLDYFGII